jgi:23S rRNA (cytidine1920-2'-O)/16S rRNA (cytidine1409-2'-O)-methyltransferase
VDGVVCTKAAAPVSSGAILTVDVLPDAYVGRGAHKLAYAVQAFAPQGLVVQGARCLDVGASTGGFTQVLLDAGAQHVVALDVGHGQLADILSADPRVTNLEGRNIRDVDPAHLDDPFDVVVADLSFISLALVMPNLAALVRAGGHGVFLVKPQFEVGRDALGKGGVVRSPGQRRQAVTRVLTACHDCGLQARGLVPSPLDGAHGNREYLLWVVATRAPNQGVLRTELIDDLFTEEGS